MMVTILIQMIVYVILAKVHVQLVKIVRCVLHVVQIIFI